MPLKVGGRYNIMKTIYETIFGSQIYGTSTPQSDTDYKGIYVADIKDIVLGKTQHSIVTSTGSDFTRNTKDDVDREMKELRRFIDDALIGQTYAIDMLYSPRELWITTSPEWEYIVQHRYRFLSRNISSFIGYCNTQASKYGLKGTRLGAVMEVVDMMKMWDPDSKLRDNPRVKTNDYVKYIIHKHKPTTGIPDEEMLEILGKMYSGNIMAKNLIQSLQIFIDRYGERAIQAMNNQGIDWKAVSHAYRCCYELQEIAKYGEVRFPLEQAPYLVQIKTGQISYPEVIQEELPRLMEESIAMIKASSLPDKADRSFWDDFITDKVYHLGTN